MILRRIIFPVCLLSASTVLCGLDLDTALAGIPAQAIEQLKEGGDTYRVDRPHTGILQAPDTPLADDFKSEAAGLSPDLFT